MARTSRDPNQMGLGFSVEETTPMPPSDWEPPTELPDRLEGPVAIDTETKDDGLAAGIGAGWAWGGGRVVGYSISARNFQAYLPIGHEPGGNMDPGLVRRWLNHVLSDDQLKLFANAMYDLGWAGVDGVRVRGPVRDVQWIEALLDEHRLSYSLEAIGQERLGEGKDETMLEEAARAYGFKKKNDVKSNLWRLPPRYVGPYAEQDAGLVRRLWSLQEPLLKAEELEALCELEHALMPLYMGMRRHGVRIDESLIDELRARFQRERDEQLKIVKDITRVNVEPWDAASIARACDAEGLKYGTTDKTDKPSITQEFLKSYAGNALADAILAARQRDKLITTFIDGVICANLHDGRVHGEIHPLRGEDGGAVTGRLSMSNPNLQFIPVRTEEGKMIRRAFLPEEGCRWASLDFSQQEPRLLVHFASLVKVRGEHLPGALEARDRYHNDPDLNYHQFAAELTGLEYKPAKSLNLAIIYGRGVKATSEELGRTPDEVRAMFAKHNEEMPFAKALARVCQSRVERRGYICSLMGRRSRFPFWEPRGKWGEGWARLDEAKKRWPGERLRRARLHKALNSLIQPSAADQTKRAMLAVYQEGYAEHVLVQVHDELGNSVEDEHTARKIARIMRDAVKLEVPSKVDVDLGANWGECD